MPLAERFRPKLRGCLDILCPSFRGEVWELFCQNRFTMAGKTHFPPVIEISKIIDFLLSETNSDRPDPVLPFLSAPQPTLSFQLSSFLRRQA
jgi:hypothetical protein